MPATTHDQTKTSYLIGLIGSGIGGSLTPAMHEQEGRHLGLNYVYRRIDLAALGLEAVALPDLLTAAEHMGYDGLNITYPCKQSVIPLLHALSDDARALGATPAGEGVDLHYQSIGTRTLADGDTLALTVAKGKAEYERIVEWLVPDGRNAYGQPDGSGGEGEVWDALKFKNPLALESPPIQYKCTVHPWMTGYVRIFDHPYFAVTDEDGKFEIKNAPVGKFRIVYWHENGIRGGRAGRFGDGITIAGPSTDLKTIDFDVRGK